MEKKHRIFLRNLPLNISENDITERFKNHGTIASVEIKEKPNAPENERKFAFVNINTTERQLNTCFQDLKNLVINGSKVHMEVAKESFLARLQREREESKKGPVAPKIEEPIRRNVIEPIRIPLIVKPEPPKRPTKKTFEVDFEVVEKPKPQEKAKPIVAVAKPEKIVEIDTAEQKKKKEAEEKRLKSLMEKKMAFRIKGGLIRQGLNAVDQKPLGKKIIFNEDGEIPKTGGTKRKAPKHLFDDDEGDDDALGNSEFKIRGNLNKKLQTLQSNYGNDKRFNLDDRFVEDEDRAIINDTETSGVNDERNWQLDILQNVLGKPVRPKDSYENPERRQKGMIRYDPTQNGNSHGEIPARTPNPKKAAKAKKQVVEINEFDNEKPPELSKDTFYNVSENLVDTLKQDEQFSLLKSFGTERSNTDYPLEQARDKEGHRFNFSTKDTFKYESSDNEGEGDENITDVPESEVKSNWNDSLFFNIDDIRFEDARKFFKKHSGTDGEFSTLRRELKQIVRSKIQNNLRKKDTWKKRKVQRVQKSR